MFIIDSGMPGEISSKFNKLIMHNPNPEKNTTG